MESSFCSILYTSFCTIFLLRTSGSIEFLRYAPLDNYSCSSESMMFRIENISTRIACVMECSLDDTCHGVYFDNVTKECKGCVADFYDKPEVLNGSIYYARKSVNTYMSMKYSNALFNNKNCFAGVFLQNYITSYQQCARACADDTNCFSYFYNPDMHQCQGCPIEYGIITDNAVLSQMLGEWTGSIYFGRFRYLGCYWNLPIILENTHQQLNNMGTEQCVRHCIHQGLLYAVTEFGTYCQCGNDLSPNTILPENSCNHSCGGNENQKCGATNIASLYIIHHWH